MTPASPIAEQRALDLADLAARLAWAYPGTTPAAHMRSAAWVADLTGLARLTNRPK